MLYPASQTNALSGFPTWACLPAHPKMKLSNPFAFGPTQVTLWTTAVYLALIASLVIVHETVPAAPAESSLPPGVNLTEAWADLQAITGQYHPYNSRANDDVRRHLIDRATEILQRNGVDFDVAG